MEQTHKERQQTKKCMITYINYSGAFDSISHTFMDQTFVDKCRCKEESKVGRYSEPSIQRQQSGIARVRDTEGQTVFSQQFEIRCGVIQGGRHNIASVVHTSARPIKRTGTLKSNELDYARPIIAKSGRRKRRSKVWKNTNKSKNKH